MEMNARSSMIVKARLEQIKLLKKTIKTYDAVVSELSKGSSSTNRKATNVVNTKRKIVDNSEQHNQTTKKIKVIVDLTEEDDDICDELSDTCDINDMMCDNNDDVIALDDDRNSCSDSYNEYNESNAINSNNNVERGEIKKPKNYKQPNLMMVYKTSVQYHSRGKIKTLSPQYVDDRFVNYSYVCDKCDSRFTNAGNLQRHYPTCDGKKKATLQSNQDAVPHDEEIGKKDKRVSNKGANHRGAFDMKEKYDVVQEYINHKSIQNIANEHDISYNTIYDWVCTEASRNQIIRDYEVNKNSKRSGKKMRGKPSVGKFFEAERQLLNELKARRQRGRRCSPKWVSRRMMQIVREIYTPDHVLNTVANDFEANTSWRERFYHRFRLTTRKRTNKKHLSMEARIEKWKEYHAKLRGFLKSGNQQDTKYGRYLPENRYNVDQVPCPFGFCDDTTIEEIGAKTVQIRGCATTDTEKRMCTLQVCIRAKGEQPRLAIIFRGAGRFLKQELAKYDPRVDV